MIFLNDVEEGGELVFPLAQNDTFSWHVCKLCTTLFANFRAEKFDRINFRAIAK